MDIFKEPLKLKFNGRSTIGTSIGGLATIFSIIFFAIGMLVKIDMIKKE